ncbi:MAG: hypothetical protein RIS52_1726 [Pseudomonadota bacterium]
MKKIIVPLMIALSLAGCGSRNNSLAKRLGQPNADGTPSAVQVVPSGVLPPPDRAALFAQERPYLIGPFDKLKIDVFGIEELSNKEVQADASGRISFPLVGVINAAGKTPTEVEEMIEAGLRGRYVRNPQVTVNVSEAVSQVFTVDGEVKKPGLYPVIGRMTLMRAVATAEGTTEFAKPQEVVIFRQVGDQQMAGLYDLKAIRAGAYADPEIYPNDVIVVGESVGRRIFKDALQIVPLITTPIVGILVSSLNNRTQTVQSSSTTSQ